MFRLDIVSLDKTTKIDYIEKDFIWNIKLLDGVIGLESSTDISEKNTSGCVYGLVI